MKTFTENDRYIYPFNKDSLVIDAGGYEGNFANIFAEKYGCQVHVFEPIRGFWMQIMERVAKSQHRGLIHVHNAGVAATSRKEVFHVKGDMSGIVADGPVEDVTLLGIADVLAWPQFFNAPIALLKLNIEGCEYEVLEALLDQGLASRFDNIQVQFHGVVPRAEERRATIRNLLQITHRITWEDPQMNIGWINFEAK